MGHTRRLTVNDWRIINAALAAYEAESWQEVLGWTDAEDDKHDKAVAQARAKVHERLNGHDLEFPWTEHGPQ
jgi:hypothetical protein